MAVKPRMEAKLPRKNELGFYEMRFESIGGLGANLAGQILSEALILGQGFNGANFSSYGAEKKGAPVKSHIRICEPDREVRTSSPVERPHLLAVFHSTISCMAGVAQGLYPDSVVVVNCAETPDEERDTMMLPSGTLATVNALHIALEEKTRINTAILGAITRASGFIDPDVVRDQIEQTFRHRYQSLVKPNLRTFDRGFEEVQIKDFPYDGKYEPVPFSRFVPDLGYANAPLGGAVVTTGNTVLRDLSPSRQGFLPAYHRDRCIDCGLCDMTCPDFVFVWEEGTDKKGRPAMVMRGADYQFCKGCLKCVEICPVDALTKEDENTVLCSLDAQIIGPPEYLGNKEREGMAPEEESAEESNWRRVS